MCIRDSPDTVYAQDDLASRWYLRVTGDFSLEGARRLSSGDADASDSAFITNESLTAGQVKERLKGLDVKALYRVLD